MDAATKESVLKTISDTWSGGPMGSIGGRNAELIMAALEAAGFVIKRQS
jgi:hypothetical protein